MINYLRPSGTKSSSLKTGPACRDTVSGSQRENVHVRAISPSRLLSLCLNCAFEGKTNKLTNNNRKTNCGTSLGRARSSDPPLLAGLPSLQLLDSHHEAEVTLGVLLDHVPDVVRLASLLRRREN